MGIKDTVRPKAVRKVDNLVGELYVHPEHLEAAIAMALALRRLHVEQD